MADTKISAMTAATHVGNSDELPIVQGLANLSTTKMLLLHAAPGEGVSLSGVTNQILSLLVAGGVLLQSPSGVLLDIQNLSGSLIRMDGSGNVFITSLPGASIELDGGYVTNCVVNVGLSQFPFFATNPGDWVLPVPTDAMVAINRIARVVSLSGAAPIP